MGLDEDLILDAIVVLVMCFETCSIMNKIYIICGIILFIIIVSFIIKGLVKIAFEILQFILSISIIGVGIYVMIKILIWFAENV